MAFGEPGDHLRRIVDPAIEPVIEIETRGRARGVEDRVRVEIVVRAVVRIDELSARLSRGAFPAYRGEGDRSENRLQGVSTCRRHACLLDARFQGLPVTERTWP